MRAVFFGVVKMVGFLIQKLWPPKNILFGVRGQNRGHFLENRGQFFGDNFLNMKIGVGFIKKRPPIFHKRFLLVLYINAIVP